MDGVRIYIVDDDQVLCGQIADYLAGHNFVTRCFYTTSALEEALRQEPCSLLLLDVMLPGEDGLQFCRRLRAQGASSRIPVIFLSALGEEADRVLGLELGADDYMVKPFSSRELLARIRALLRRAEDAPASSPVIEYRFGAWTMEVRSRLLVDPSGLASNLSAAEFRLLRVFLEHPYEVLDREALLKVIQRPADTPFDRVLDVQISRLRARLGESAKEQNLIRTARGDGYMLATSVKALCEEHEGCVENTQGGPA